MTRPEAGRAPRRSSPFEDKLRLTAIMRHCTRAPWSTWSVARFDKRTDPTGEVPCRRGIGARDDGRRSYVEELLPTLRANSKSMMSTFNMEQAVERAPKLPRLRRWDEHDVSVSRLKRTHWLGRCFCLASCKSLADESARIRLAPWPPSTAPLARLVSAGE